MTTPFHPARPAQALGRLSGLARRGPPPADCSIARSADSCAVAAIRGDLDERGSTRLRADLTAAAARGHWRLVIDLSEVTSLDAAPLTCAGVTTYKAVKVSGARPADLVSVVGVGGLGHLAVQYAAIAGATVVGIDVQPDKLDLAKQLGASHTVNAAQEDPAEAVQRLGGADVAIALTVQPEAIRAAFDSLRRGGRLVLVSLPKDGILTVPIFDTVLKGISVIGSIVGTRQDLADVFALHAAGRTHVAAETRRLDQVNDAFTEVLNGRVPARLVFRF